jgi:hypothetical protein
MILFPIVSNFGPSKLLSSLAGLLSMGVFIGSIILGATNYRGKRKEIFKGILYLILVPVVIALVGFGVCMLVILGLGHH